MHPKKTISKKKHNRKTVQRKSKKQKTTMSQSQNVYVYTHKPQTQRTQSHVRKNTHNTVSTPIIVPFVQPLPPNHPFNTNVPQNQSGVSPNVTVNPNVSEQINELQKQMQQININKHTTQKTPIKNLKIKKTKGLTKLELLKRATELGIDHLKSGATKPEIWEAISEAESELKKLDPSSNIIL